MRRFIITSELFTGQAEAVYKDNGMLCKIDLTGCDFNQAFTNSFKNKVPAHLSDIETAFDLTKVTIIEADFEVTFEMFWNKYNNKVNRKRTLALWEKLSKSKQVKAFYGIDAYNKYLSKKDWRNRQDPDTYLRNETFENEWQ